ncbi:alanine--tRNA ligase [Zunongwangia atlantica]|uniref:Alanine--tRNA ligase n=1 Tax=Zunongwangia atlantica 22II14-10F7 TaxID=1185767 RepID=A0A1Y1T6G0_9FLAO|nr:alanine--tRNA ligase [Zunongwangia atlantica]ORL46626.1 alanyl-tRNA ligase [Zunongwangia atlantica 22II14-10F7]
MKSQEIRKSFLEFFKAKSHSIVPSAPMVLKDDPSLMFTNAGMVQFKEFFLGNSVPKNTRVTDSQKCLRVSGKHNDLEEVGHDTYHHTMFEMLGNWSFGDYFKEEAISWSWELLTEVFKIDKESLYVSVFEGSKEDGVGLDTEALEIWKKIVPEDRIIYGNKKDNFWEMGDQGPCGPCSEIHVDIRSAEEKTKKSGKELVNADHPQVVEIWNLVFMQFNRKADGSLEELPAKHIDTGMGFERLCMVMQGKQSNYDTDVFTPLIAEIEKITNSTYGKSEETNIAIRVIADHVRAVAFSIADGQLPSNSGAGYVIRRILRRAIRYGFTFLDTKEAFIYKLVERLKNQMGDAFPELVKQQQLIENVIKEEELSFLRTLEQGLVMLENIVTESKDKEISGVKAFELYDTFGFPIDLTALILKEKGFSLNIAEFEAELKKQKERSRAATQVTSGDWEEITDVEENAFVGYDQLETQVKIAKYRKVETKKQGTLYQIVLTKTPFYPEGGGQVGDKGYLKAGDEKISIIDTKKESNQIIHFAKKLPQDISAEFTAVVDASARAKTAANHTATHLLHQALRQILGTHVEQKGSMVQPNYMRFDFSHFSKLSSEEIEQVEEFVNDRIKESLELEEQRNIAHQEALDQGAIALFGEKYGDSVRAIRFGKSMELCGGTHVKNTADIWYFKITGESAVASGIRRIEAITGDAVKEYFTKQTELLEEVQGLLKNAKDPVKAISGLQDENAELKKQVETLLKDKAKNLKSEIKNEIQEINGIQFLAKEVDLDAGGIKDLAFQLGGEIDNLFLLFGTEQKGKALLSCYISKDLVGTKDLNAGTIVRELGKYIQGGGGGQPFFATAGGKNPAGISEALAEAKKYIE